MWFLGLAYVYSQAGHSIMWSTVHQLLLNFLISICNFASTCRSTFDSEPSYQEDRHFKMPHSIPPPVSSKKRRSTEDPKRQGDQISLGVTDKEDSVKRSRSTTTDAAPATKG